MRSAERKKVQWSPHNSNQFIVAGSDLRLYEIRSKDGPSGGHTDEVVLKVEDPRARKEPAKKAIYLIGADTEIQNLKCADWCLDSANPKLLAVGMSTGRVVLTTMADDNKQRKEFVPKQSRVCNAVAWNPVMKNLFVTGLDKVRSDYSCCVWDINQTGAQGSGSLHIGEPVLSTSLKDNAYNLSSIVATERVERPFRQFANSEAIVALSWLPNTPTALAAGTGNRWLRIYDLRDPSRVIASVGAHQKSVFGVCFDPHRDNLLATFSEESTIKLWDIRKLKDPTIQLPAGSKVAQIGWCPTRGTGILASIGKDEKNIKLWDVKSGVLGADQAEERAKPRNFKPYTCTVYNTPEPLSSFSWHPERSKLLSMNSSSVVEVINIHESMPVAFSPHSEIAFAYSKEMIEATLQDQHTVEERTTVLKGNADMSLVMHARAEAGYSADPKVNTELSAHRFEDPELAYVWNWVYDMKYNLAKGKLLELKGIFNIIITAKSSGKKDTVTDQGTPFSIFTSPERSFCLRLCGWGFNTDDDMEKQLSAMAADGRVEKAAAIAVFNSRIKLAITLLSKFQQSGLADSSANLTASSTLNLKLVAMALSGYTDGGSPLWRASSEPLRQSMSDPYINAIFSFLCNTKPDYWAVLQESDVSLRDKIAFACRFLDDERLRQFLERTKVQVIAQGRLHGLLLTGIDSVGTGIDLLQQYLNRSADLQTVALLTCHVQPRKIKDVRPEFWIKLYRQMLDRWQLWTQRAKLDVLRGSFFELKPPPQVFVRCNFCNTPLTFEREEKSAAPQQGQQMPPGFGQGMAKAGYNNMFGGARRGGSEKKRLNACPTCRKPLPRCSICLLTLDCTPPAPENRHTVTSGDGAVNWHSGAHEFDDWFTWCQTCRHGGHAKHIFEWFQTTEVCPVSDCNCKCSSVDRSFGLQSLSGPDDVPPHM